MSRLCVPVLAILKTYSETTQIYSNCFFLSYVHGFTSLFFSLLYCPSILFRSRLWRAHILSILLSISTNNCHHTVRAVLAHSLQSSRRFDSLLLPRLPCLRLLYRRVTARLVSAQSCNIHFRSRLPHHTKVCANRQRLCYK